MLALFLVDVAAPAAVRRNNWSFSEIDRVSIASTNSLDVLVFRATPEICRVNQATAIASAMNATVQPARTYVQEINVDARGERAAPARDEIAPVRRVT